MVLRVVSDAWARLLGAIRLGLETGRVRINAGKMCICTKICAENPDVIDIDQAVALFKADPARYFTYRRAPSVWPEAEPEDIASGRPIFPNDLRVLVFGHTLGFVERVSIQGNTATIGHIAVEKALRGQQGKKYGIGPVLARAYAEKVHALYGVDRIVFCEDHHDYNNAGYAKFFLQLGATALPIDRRTTVPGRPNFEWLQAAW